ncbi:MAG: Transcriptional regulatory protein yycF [Thermoleophilia bacterium]|nr:Transcriptional regulatory protein yycF [Thermoleophilia bacterium]
MVAAPDSPAADAPVVLVVDDDDDLRAIVEFRLRREGLTVHSASDGDQALAVARDVMPQVCVLDVMMPKRSGHEVLRELRADPATRGIRVILLTARAQERDVNDGFELGADDYLTKPFSPGELATRVRAQLARARA